MVRIATYNVENLFSRPVLFNMRDHAKASLYLEKIKEMTRLLDQPSYAADEVTIEKLYEEVKDYIVVNIRASKVGRYLVEKGDLKPKGRDDWDGFIDLKRERFDEATVAFTAKVISTVKADIQALVEVESAPTLQMFNTDRLGSSYRDRIVVDGNDPRGIDVGLVSKKNFPIVTAKTNIFARQDNSLIFSRDCLEVEIRLANNRSLFVLVNHFKAKDRDPAASDKKRKAQASEVSRILKERYDLSEDYVVVAGDLNDEPHSDALAPLYTTPGLSNVLDVTGHPADDRWTYYYAKDKAYNAIDYLFVSDALKPKVKAAGLERRGMYGLDKLTNGAQSSFPGLDHWKLAGSDHALLWFDADL
ncbi:metal-dependent hydrolase [Rhizobium anhuiense]|uniref:endonuclease/exonuclease/phosphatase family protein n=1 Tax=Rhizobium anhuiense TaxID=1184720 RepID=UPI000BEA0003|nr:endonuclease/exonuclease/phosphatase family protein [Rhizobium anhuiense]PDS33781.1 metal-dependent hydrolase [Rhizobium anhuiense]